MNRVGRFALVLCAIAFFAGAPVLGQTYNGLRIEGPDQVSNNQTASYRVFAEFDNSTEFEVTLFAALSVTPGVHASINQFGELTTVDVPGDQIETIDAMFVFDSIPMSTQKAVTILDTPAAGYALDFDGSNDYVEVQHSASLGLTSSLTIEAHARIDNAQGGNQLLLFKGDTQSGLDPYYLMVRSGQVRFAITNESNIVSLLAADIPSVDLSEFHHIAGVFDDPADEMRLYFDGALIGTLPSTITPLADQDGMHLWFGGAAILNQMFNGVLDEVRIWNHARSQADILSTMHRPLTGGETGLVGYWPMNEGGGQTVQDASPNGNDGTLGVDLTPGGDSSDPAWLLSSAAIYGGPAQFVDITGLPTLSENWNAEYRATVFFSGGAIDGTQLVNWEIDPSSVGAFAAPGSLSTGVLLQCVNQPATISATYSDALGMTTGQLPVTIVPAGGGGSALDFDGQNDYVRIPASAGLNPTEEFTLEAWIKPDGIGERWSRIFDHFGNNATGFALNFQTNNDRRIQLRVKGPTGDLGLSNDVDGDIYFGEWHHVAAVYSGSNDYARLYVDGVLRVEDLGIGSVSYVPGTDMFIGDGFVHSQEQFDGAIDEVRLWNLARTESEIGSTMFTRLDGGEPGLIGYWPLDEGAGEFIADLTAFQHHAIRGSNGAAQDASDPSWMSSTVPIGPPAMIDGDASLDGLTNGEDVSWFVGLILAGQFGDPTRIEHVDFDCDGITDVDDVGPFVAALTSP